MPDRSRLRRGREVFYWPTSAEQTSLGAGPWPALITQVNADGTCDLVTDPPGASAVGAALASPLVTSPDGSDAGTTQTLANELKADVNALVVRVNQLIASEGRKAAVRQGGQPGQFSLDAGPNAV